MTLPTKLFHYSCEEITELSNKSYLNDLEVKSSKPTGLWVSVEESDDDMSWFEWCKKEDFFLEFLTHRHKVKISEDAKILHLKSPEEILMFTNEYPENSPFIDLNYMNILWINWGKVKQLYDGIIISPYQWECRLDSRCSWYYGWDCSSGCIWNIDKISIELDSITDMVDLKAEKSRNI